MNAHRVLWVVLPLALTAAGCDKSSSGAGATPSATTPEPAVSSAPVPTVDPSAAAAAAASASAAAFVAKGATRRHVGLAGVLLRGAYEGNLTDEQKATLDKADDALYADQASSPWTAAKAFHTDLVSFIRASKFDNSKLQADYAAIDKAVQAGQAREADALNTLHGALDAAQRQALVDQVKAKRAAREARETPPAAAGADGGAPDWTKKRLARLTAELTLDDAQQKAVGALLAKDTTATPAARQARREASQKRVDALLTEFAKDTFDGKKVDIGMGTKSPHEAMEHTATFDAALVALLHPDQREKLAVQTERRGNRPTRTFEEVDSAMGFGSDEEPQGPGPRLPR